MKTAFEMYKPRKIEFREIVKVRDWQIKVYTITNRESFGSQQALSTVRNELPQLLAKAINSPLATYKVAFLIVHEGREGLWVLLNWWSDGEMVETQMNFIDKHQLQNITSSPYATRSLVCVWELEVFIHERQAWINHVLMQAKEPDFAGYLQDVLGGQ